MTTRFTIENIEDQGLVFNNYTQYKIVVSLLAVPPKRKHVDFLVINSGEFRLYEQPIDITRLIFRFEF